MQLSSGQGRRLGGEDRVAGARRGSVGTGGGGAAWGRGAVATAAAREDGEGNRRHGDAGSPAAAAPWGLCDWASRSWPLRALARCGARRWAGSGAEPSVGGAGSRVAVAA